MSSNPIPHNNPFFRQLLFLSLMIGIGVVIFGQLGSFISAFLGSITLYVVLRSTLIRLTEQLHWRSWVASLTLLSGTCILLLGIGYFVFDVIASEISSVDINQVADSLNRLVKKLNDLTGYQIISEKLLIESKGVITNIASLLINTTYNLAANTFMMLIILYFMLASGRKMENILLKYAPFSGKGLRLIKSEVRNMIFSNAIGIPAIMLAQTITAGLIYWVLGVESALFWAFLTAILGLVPMVGTAMITIPLSVYLISMGDLWQGVALLIAAVLIIANVDNVCRIFLMKRAADTHPLIVIFGVILGIPLFGFWGIIFGPLMVSVFLLLIHIYYIEYKLNDPSTELE